ncbi:MAG TPA: carboxypeptidase regulatory-like domain-containing protein [Terriglobales bacterium]|nr:carboxypeptidase regulatory-like domain-containing protein [Terriglobales bacterium]
MKRWTSSLAIFSIMLLALAATGVAQTGNQGSIEGTLADASGAVIAGAQLTATNQQTGIQFSTKSNAEGLFVFPVLPVGIYDLKAEHVGFATVTSKNLQVKVGSKTNLPLSMGVSGTVETVNVSDAAPLIETTRSSFSTTVDNTSVEKLPTNGRNFIDFVLLTPGVTRDVRTGDISFAGQRGTLNSLTVDGADNNNTFFGQTTGRTGSGRAPYQFSQDAVQEFQVNSNGYSAELGRAGGAVVNVITKSGTNAFHGTGFWFFRDRGMNADDPINKQTAALAGTTVARKPAYHFNQFGGNVGGPIVKNKAFFFFDYDGQRNTQPNPITFSLPTIAAPTAFETAAINYLSARSAAWNRSLNQDTYLGKVDWNVNSSNLLSVRYNRQNFTGEGFESGGATNSFEHTGASLVTTDTIAASFTSTITPALVNVGRFNYQIDKEPGKANSVNPEAIVRQGSFSFTIGRNFFSPRETTIHRQQYADTLTYVKGRHTLKGGLDIIHDDILNYFPGNFSGSFTFNNLQSFGCSLQNVSLTAATCPGASASYTQAFAGTGTTGATTKPNIFEIGLFLQDDWKVRSNLTLNLGIRWDLQKFAAPSVQNPAALAAGYDTKQLNTDNNNIGPRFGFAWSPWLERSLVVRGGYGIFYGRTPSIMVGTAHSNNGINVGTFTFSGAAIPSYPNTLCGAPVETPSCAAPAGGSSAPPSIYLFKPGYQQPIVQQANLGTEFALMKDMAISVGYQFVKGNHLQRTRDVNLGTPVLTPITVSTTGQVLSYRKYPAARPATTLGRVSQFEDSANSVYHGLNVQLTKRFSHHFQFTSAYTWGKVIDDAPDATAVVPFGSDDAKMNADPLLIAFDRGPGVNDQRHRWVSSVVWTMDYAKNMNPVAKAILNGWELSGIFTAQSGQPYTGLVSSDLNSDSNSRTDRAPNEGRNAYRLPSTYSLDPRLLRNINFTEHAKVQIFAEAFNILNHFNVSGVRTTQYALTAGQLVPQTAPATRFGLPNAHTGARIFQLGAKISF